VADGSFAVLLLSRGALLCERIKPALMIGEKRNLFRASRSNGTESLAEHVPNSHADRLCLRKSSACPTLLRTREKQFALHSATF
jgi:hypothetical protein